MKPRILITGASGYLGGHLILQAPQNTEIFAMFHSQSSDETYGARWTAGDLLDETLPSRLLRDIKPTAVIHNAALSKPEACDNDPDQARELNVEATDRLAAAAASAGAKMVYVSTDMVFDGNHAPYKEDSPAHPCLLYGQTKLDGESRTLNRSKRHVAARSAVIYGGEGIFGSNFAITMIQKWKLGESTPVFTDQYRSHVSVKWLAKTLYLLASNDFGGTIHLGGAEGTSRAEFAFGLASYLGFHTRLLTETSFVGKLQSPRPANVIFDLSLASSIPETQPIDLATGFALEWQKNKQDL